MIFIINAIATSVWMALIWGFDEFSHTKKNGKTLVLFMAAGIMSVLPSQFLYEITPFEVFEESTEIIPRLITGMFFVGPIEESTKFFMFLFLTRLVAPIREPRDGILYAAAVAVGFAAAENLQYGNDYGLLTLLIRSVLCTAGHVVYGVIWGFSYGLVAYEGIRWRGRTDYRLVVIAVLPAAFAHGLYDFLVSMSLTPMAIALDIVVLFIALRLYRFHGNQSPYRKYTLAQYDEAVNAYRKALTVNPNNSVLNKRIALFYLYGNCFSESLAHIERLVRADPYNPYLRCLRGAALLLSGDKDGGKEAIERWHRRLTRMQRETLHRNMGWLIRDVSKRDEILEVLGTKQVWVRWPVAISASG